MQPSFSTPQISSTASPMKLSSKSSQNHSPKCSHSPPSSMNKLELSTTSGPTASWKRASARAAHSLPFLHPLLLPASCNCLTLNYAKELQLASSMATQGTTASEASHTSLDTSMTFLTAYHLRTYDSSVTNLPPSEPHWVVLSTQ